MKYRPWYPLRPFASPAQSIRWVEEFILWYNEKRLHRAVKFVTPNDRHTGTNIASWTITEEFMLLRNTDIPSAGRVIIDSGTDQL